MTSVEDKENTTQVETLIIDDIDSEKKENLNTFFSPPKKKFKQDALPFAKLPKNEGTPKKDEKELSDTQDIAERQLAELSNKHKTPVNVKNSKNKKSVKDVSPKNSPPSKEVDTTKNVSSEKKVKTSKASPVVNKTKDVKSDGIQFPKLSKEDALKESEKEVKNMIEKEKENDNCVTPGKNGDECAISEAILVDGASNNENDESCETPIAKKTPSSAKKVSPISKEERQKLKEEKEAQKAARLKEMEEKRKKKEEEKVQKQAEKEKRENERKEKERLKEEEKKKREEEKKKKEEEKKLKEEERLKKEEQMKLEKEKRDAEKEKKELEKKLKEEQKKQEEEKKRLEDEALKKKKEKAANQFRSFFTKKRTSDTKAAVVEEEEPQRFKALPVKPDMLHAPLVRNNNIDRQLIDKILIEEIPELDTYLKVLASKCANDNKPKYISRRKKRREFEEMRKLEISKNKTECKKETDEKPKANISMDIDVVVIDDNSNDIEDDDDTENEDTVCDKKYLYISKLLQFSENTRPPYYGTWRKKTAHISGRKPFGRDTDVFNYDIDSDEEWIDEPGENLSDAADEDEEEEKETEDDQDGFFVPHGYLSDDEGIKDEIEDDDEENNNEGAPKSTSANTNNEEDKLKLKVCTFERRFQRIKHHKPICIGISYAKGLDTVNALLKDYMKVTLFKPVNEKEKDIEGEEDTEIVSPESKNNQTPGSSIPLTVPEEAMPILIKYIHGNTATLPTLMLKFREYWSSYAKNSGIRNNISKRQLERKIHSIASRTGVKEGGKTFYVVKDDVISKYGLPSDLQYDIGLPELKTSNNTPNDPISTQTKDSSSCAIENGSNVVDTSMEIN